MEISSIERIYKFQREYNSLTLISRNPLYVKICIKLSDNRRNTYLYTLRNLFKYRVNIFHIFFEIK